MKQNILTIPLVLFFLISNFPGEAQTKRYSVQWGTTSVIFSEISGVDTGIQVTEYREISTNRNRLASAPQGIIKNITLKHAVCKRDNELFKWFSTASINTKERRNLIIKLLNESSEPVKTWYVTNASPVKVEGLTLVAKGTDVAVETVVLTYERFEP